MMSLFNISRESMSFWNNGLVTRNPISGVSDKVMLKPAGSATDTRWNVKI